MLKARRAKGKPRRIQGLPAAETRSTRHPRNACSRPPPAAIRKPKPAWNRQRKPAPDHQPARQTKKSGTRNNENREEKEPTPMHVPDLICDSYRKPCRLWSLSSFSLLGRPFRHAHLAIFASGHVGARKHCLKIM